MPVTVISNTTNRGFPAAINQGLKVARGEYLVLLNNDVVVTDSWLEQLVGLANAGIGTGSGHVEDRFRRRGSGAHRRRRAATEVGETYGRLRCGVRRPAHGKRRTVHCHCRLPTPTPSPIGLVGPMSNYATPPQLVENVPYHDLPAMHAFARQWRDEHRGKWFTTHKLSGFCLLMKRAVYETIGGLDERFGIGFFDDDDLAERARRAGFELAVARDLFVHHFGSRTLSGNGIDAEKLLDENARRFADKWGLEKANGKRVSLRPWPDFLAESQREFARQVDEPEKQWQTGAACERRGAGDSHGQGQPDDDRP